MCHVFGNMMCIGWHFTFGWYSGESRSWDTSVTVVTYIDNGLNDLGLIFWQRQGGFMFFTGAKLPWVPLSLMSIRCWGPFARVKVAIAYC